MTDLQQYRKKLMSSLTENMKEASESLDRDAIHDMRVHIKRLRSLEAFLSLMGNDPVDRKLMKRLRKLFKRAGKVRDFQVQRKLVDQYRVISDKAIEVYLEQRFYKMEKATQKLVKSLETFRKDEIQKINHSLEKAIDDIDEDDIDRWSLTFVDERLARIHSLASSSKDGRHLHSIRKYLKQVLYIQEFLKKTKDLKLIPKPTIKKLDKLQEQLGNWHDLEVLEVRLADLAGNYRDLLREVLESVRLDRRQIENELVDKLRSSTTLDEVTQNGK